VNGARGPNGPNGENQVTTIRLTAADVLIDDLRCADPDVVRYFADADEPTRGDLAGRALALGIIGLRAVGFAGQVELVEREFLRLSHRFDQALGSVETTLLQRVHDTFDPQQAGSVSAGLATSVGAAHQAATDVIAQARNELGTLIADSFNPDLATSCVYRVTKLVADTRAELDKAFDPSYQGSHLARLTAFIDSYFGPGGSVADLVATQVNPVRQDILRALQGVRDLIVGQATAAEERRRSPASGLDFEMEVEAVLCRLAAIHGDTVERLGTQAGDAGRSKQGDFAVQLPDGSRFVVEAKKRSTPLPLRGDRGLLAMLQESMTNRAATFAIAVASDDATLPREVGGFNDYDTDKIVCRFGDRGELLEVAYRWARASLLAAVRRDEGVDVPAIGAALDEARRGVRELARIEAKARAIAHGADEIQGMLTFQLRRVNLALDNATTELSSHESRAMS
jgi:hypothetical protein